MPSHARLRDAVKHISHLDQVLRRLLDDLCPHNVMICSKIAAAILPAPRRTISQVTCEISRRTSPRNTSSVMCAPDRSSASSCSTSGRRLKNQRRLVWKAQINGNDVRSINEHGRKRRLRSRRVRGYSSLIQASSMLRIFRMFCREDVTTMTPPTFLIVPRSPPLSRQLSGSMVLTMNEMIWSTISAN